MPTVDSHQPEEIRRALEPWLAARLGADRVSIDDIASPAQGFSSETILMDVSWSQAGASKKLGMVARIQPTRHQVIWRNDARLQFDMMKAMQRHAVPVANCRWIEEKAGVLRSPFFVMDRVSGHTPLDNPPYGAAGWVFDMTPAERRELWNNAIETMAVIHRIDWRDGFGFLLERAGGRAGLDGVLAHLDEWYEWALGGRPHPTVDPAIAWLRAHRPSTEPPTGISWGDCRIGNMIFGDDRSVLAVTDWEMAGLGPAEMDLAWWLFLDRFHSSGYGLDRLPGLPGEAETVARYAELLGRPIADLHWYQVLAGVRFGLVMVRLGFLIKELYQLTDDSMAYVSPVTQILADLLGLPAPAVPRSS